MKQINDHIISCIKKTFTVSISHICLLLKVFLVLLQPSPAAQAVACLQTMINDNDDEDFQQVSAEIQYLFIVFYFI